MGLFYHNVRNHNSEIYIWEISEPEAFFLEAIPWDDKQRVWLNTLHPKRKMEFLASRYLIYHVTGKIDEHLYKNEFGKLYIRGGGPFISISHSGTWTGLALGSSNVGFDLQAYSDKIMRIAPRFLHAEEIAGIQASGVFEIPLLTCAWAIKEAVYKAYGNKAIHFAEQIRLCMPESSNQQIRFESVQLVLEDCRLDYTLHYDHTEAFAWALAQEQ